MDIYIITWLLFSVFSFIELNTNSSQNRLNKTMLFICFILLVFQIGLRWETGTDWYPYLEFFKYEKFKSLFDPTEGFELGYVIFNRLIYIISDNYSVLLFIHAILFFSLLIKSFKIYTPYVILTLFLYYSIHVGMTGSNRQLLALAIGMFGVTKLLNGKKYLFFISIVLSCLFHMSALLLLVYYFLNRKINNSILIAGLVISVLIGFSGIPEKIFAFAGGLNEMSAEKSDAYIAMGVDTTSTGSIIGIIKRIVLSIVFIAAAKKIGKIDPKYYICLNGFIVSVAFFFLFKSVPIMAGRALLYFNVMEPVLMVYLLYLIKDMRIKNLVVFGYCIIAVLYFFQSFQQYPDLFLPYKGIFINNNFYRKMY